MDAMHEGEKDNGLRRGAHQACGVIGVGWIGGLRALSLSRDPRTVGVLVADIDEARARQVATETGAAGWSTDYHQWLGDVGSVIIATTPESTHFPIARECLDAGKHVLLEKPIALTLAEARELTALAEKRGVHLTIGFTQRFNPKMAWVRSVVSAGEIGAPISVLVSRNMSHSIGLKVTSRGALGPELMQAPHDLDLCLWWLAGDAPVSVYAQSSRGTLYDATGVADCTWIVVRMSSGATAVVGANWSVPGEYRGAQRTAVELVGRDGAVFVDDSRRDAMVTSRGSGVRRGMATMPGEDLGPVFSGPIDDETRAFVAQTRGARGYGASGREAVAVLELCLAAERSAAAGVPQELSGDVDAVPDGPADGVKVARGPARRADRGRVGR